MKKILSFLPIIILLNSCQIAESQSISEEQREEQAFKQLIDKIEETKRETIISQDKATKQESKIVNGAVEKIVTLKEEVKTLKSELNEKNEKLNGIISDTGSKFKLLPISNN
jgi:dynactin complex subunit